MMFFDRIFNDFSTSNYVSGRRIFINYIASLFYIKYAIKLTWGMDLRPTVLPKSDSRCHSFSVMPKTLFTSWNTVGNKMTNLFQPPTLKFILYKS